MGVQGFVHQVNIYKGESPRKYPVEEAVVTARGLQGNFNRYRTERMNDDPEQAVLILPLETIGALSTQGYSLGPGYLGENLTTVGIPYDAFTVGCQFQVGEQVVLEIGKPCNPCKNLLTYGERILKDAYGRRGWYARVVKEGIVRKGDPIHKLP